VLFERSTISQVIETRHAGVIDEDRERFDSLDSFLNLRSVGHVQGQRRDATIRVGQGLARTGIHSLRASPQCFLHQRLPDTSIGPGHQNCFACDCHTPSYQIRRLEDYR
jgi:hypothetical protein